MSDALTAAKYIRDNAMRLVEANAAGQFDIRVSCTGNFCSSYTSGFAIKFEIWDGLYSEWVTADTLENCVAEVLRRRAVRATQSQVKLPPYEPRKDLPALQDRQLHVDFSEVKGDDDGIPF